MKIEKTLTFFWNQRKILKLPKTLKNYNNIIKVTKNIQNLQLEKIPDLPNIQNWKVHQKAIKLVFNFINHP